VCAATKIVRRAGPWRRRKRGIPDRPKREAGRRGTRKPIRPERRYRYANPRETTATGAYSMERDDRMTGRECEQSSRDVVGVARIKGLSKMDPAHGVECTLIERHSAGDSVILPVCKGAEDVRECTMRVSLPRGKARMGALRGTCFRFWRRVTSPDDAAADFRLRGGRESAAQLRLPDRPRTRRKRRDPPDDEKLREKISADKAASDSQQSGNAFSNRSRSNAHFGEH